MFGHKKTEDKITAPTPPPAIPKEFTLNQVGELLEKNLKWSQIIYEQNRKINRKLLWSSVMSWVYFIIIVGPIVLAAVYLPPIVGNIYNQYQGLLGNVSAVKTQMPTQTSLDQILKMFPIDAAQEARLKSLLK